MYGCRGPVKTDPGHELVNDGSDSDGGCRLRGRLFRLRWWCRGTVPKIPEYVDQGILSLFPVLPALGQPGPLAPRIGPTASPMEERLRSTWHGSDLLVIGRSGS